MPETDTTPEVRVKQPTLPGFYHYSGGAQSLIFLRTAYDGQWYVINDNADVSKCDWGYIEQALGVWDLVRIEPEKGHHVGHIDV